MEVELWSTIMVDTEVLLFTTGVDTSTTTMLRPHGLPSVQSNGITCSIGVQSHTRDMLMPQLAEPPVSSSSQTHSHGLTPLSISTTTTPQTSGPNSNVPAVSFCAATDIKTSAAAKLQVMAKAITGQVITLAELKQIHTFTSPIVPLRLRTTPLYKLELEGMSALSTSPNNTHHITL